MHTTERTAIALRALSAARRRGCAARRWRPVRRLGQLSAPAGAAGLRLSSGLGRRPVIRDPHRLVHPGPGRHGDDDEGQTARARVAELELGAERDRVRGVRVAAPPPRRGRPDGATARPQPAEHIPELVDRAVGDGQRHGPGRQGAVDHAAARRPAAGSGSPSRRAPARRRRSAGRPVAKGAVMAALRSGPTKYQTVSRLPTPITMARNSRCGRRLGDPRTEQSRRVPHRPSWPGPRARRRCPWLMNTATATPLTSGRHAVLQRVGDAQVVEPRHGQAGQQHDAEPGAEIAAIDRAHGDQEQHGQASRRKPPRLAWSAARGPGQQARAEGEQQRGRQQQQPGHQRPGRRDRWSPAAARRRRRRRRCRAAPAGSRRRPASASSRRCALAATRLAGTSATVFEALAATGGMPTASMAGKVKKVAPPAMALTVPPAKPAASMSRTLDRDTRALAPLSQPDPTARTRRRRSWSSHERVKYQIGVAQTTASARRNNATTAKPACV